MKEPAAAAIAANRFGLGARPGDLARIGDDAQGWLAAQLGGGAPTVQEANLQASSSILSQTLDLRRRERQAKAAAAEAAKMNSETAQVADVMKIGQLNRPIYVAEITARLRESARTQRPFIERLTHFWSNHFAVSVDKAVVLGLAGAMEREAIRPDVLGSFTDLLLAVERHPAMLMYLDNHLSVGPSSRLAQRISKRREVGINENLAREILELHTLGVKGGYSQKDVTTFAQVISGWSIGGYGPRSRGEAGAFLFREELHEPGAKVVLGKRYTDGGLDQGVAVLRDLAVHPATARHIATKLARHFIADEPDERSVQRIERAFLESKGDLPTVYRALIETPAAWARPLAKYKTPSDYIISVYRGLSLPLDGRRAAVTSFQLLGQRIYAPGSPAGWPDKSDNWDGASALLKRIEWADTLAQRLGSERNAAVLAPELLGETLSAATRSAVARAASGAQALTLLLTAPEFLRR